MGENEIDPVKEKNNGRNWLRYISTIIIFGTLSFLLVNSNNDLIEDYELISERVKTLEAIADYYNGSVESFDIREFNIRSMVAEVWLLSLEEDAQKSIVTKVDKINTECLKTEGVYLTRSYFTEDANADHGKFLVAEHDNADIVFQKNGTVKCYSKPIMTPNPPSVDCKKICEVS